MIEELTQRLHRAPATPPDLVHDQAAAIHQSVLRRDMVECLPALDVLDIFGDQLRVARARQILLVRHSSLLSMPNTIQLSIDYSFSFCSKSVKGAFRGICGGLICPLRFSSCRTDV